LKPQDHAVILDPIFPQVDENSSYELIIDLLKYTQAVLTTRKGKIVGIITKANLRKLIKSK